MTGPASRRLPLCLTAAVLFAALPALGRSDDPPAAPAEEVSLEERQRLIADRFGRLEDSLLKMARYLRKTEPERSELLVRALQKAREERIEVRMGSVADLLRSDAAAGLTANFGDAVAEQARLIDGMRDVLGLLRSEDRRKEIDDEQARLKALMQDVKRLETDQKAAAAANRRGEAASRVAAKQGDVTDRTDDLLEDIKADDRAAENSDDAAPGEPGGESAPAEGKPGDTAPGKSAEGEPREGAAGEAGEGSEADAGEPGEGDPSEGEPTDPAEGEPGEKPDPEDGAEPGESGEPSEPGEPSDGEPSPPSGSPPGQPGPPGEAGEGGESEPSDGPPPEQTPGREQLEEAKKAMEDALRELEQAEREGAQEAQEEAVKKLAEAREKLEEILRQLREEEAELVLRALEVRFQKMLTMQQAVLTGTLSVAAVEEPTDRERTRTRDLARQERAILLEAAKALQLLREDGSSVAFPEALEQVVADVEFAAELLTKNRVDDLTQQVERDVIESLEELIDALQQELEKLKEQQESGQPPPGEGGEQEQALVDKISELKMLRTLQKGVNRRTRLLGLERPAPGESADVDVEARLRDLAGRQSRIESATYDLAVGKAN